MAGQIEITVALGSMVTMERDVPATLNLSPALSTCLGYISQADISFADTAGVYTIDAAGSGFSAAHFDGNDGEQILVSSSGGTNSGVNDGLYTLVSDADAQLVVTEVVITQTAAAAGTVVIYGVQVYNITPTKKSENLLIVYSEGLEAAGEVGLIPCILNGDFWAANTPLYTAFAATAVTGTPHGTYFLVVETGKYLQSGGTIKLMLVPKATNELYTDHQPAAGFLELP